ncbi:MAG: GNAT family N-acetyltransferase [Pseudomonadales bacterium]
MPINCYNQPIGEPINNWQPCDLPDTGPLQGNYCRIEKLNPTQHSRALYKALCENSAESNWTYLPYGPFEGETQFNDWLSTQVQSTDPLFYTIIDLESDCAIGMASYLRIEPAIGVIEVGHIHFSHALQRTPHATEAMYLMMKRVFDTGYRRYEWKCDALNAPSKRAAERLGFSYEGCFKQATMYKGRNRDTAWYAITDEAWQPQSQAFERWLAADNFDAQGKQRTSLAALKD